MVKVTELSQASLPLSDNDLIEVVQGVGFAPSNRKVQVGDVVGTPDITSQRMAGTTLFADEFDDAEVEAGWVKVENTPAIIWREAGGGLSVKVQGQVVGEAGRPHALVRPLPVEVGTSPFTLDIATRRMTSYATNYVMYGALLTSGVTYGSGNICWFMPYQHGSTAGASISVRWGANWAANTDFGSPNWSGDWATYMYQRMVFKGGTSWQFYISCDGIHWVDFLNGVKTMAGFTPTHFGLGMGTWGNAGIYGICSTEYIRLYAGDLGANPAQPYDEI